MIISFWSDVPMLMVVSTSSAFSKTFMVALIISTFAGSVIIGRVSESVVSTKSVVSLLFSSGVIVLSIYVFSAVPSFIT
jgi:hypothetical protein